MSRALTEQEEQQARDWSAGLELREEAMLKPKYVALIALAALVVSGPLQTMGLLPQTALGDASNSFIKKIADHLAWWRE